MCGLVALSSLSCLVFFSSLPLRVGVRGSARAALRARTLSPNTIVSSVTLSCLLLCCSAPRLSSPSAFLSFGMAAGDSPCVGVFGGHDSNREPVSFVTVFLVVACSAFAVSAVAATTVAFGAEDSPVVRMVGSA